MSKSLYNYTYNIIIQIYYFDNTTLIQKYIFSYNTQKDDNFLYKLKFDRVFNALEIISSYKHNNNYLFNFVVEYKQYQNNNNNKIYYPYPFTLNYNSYKIIYNLEYKYNIYTLAKIKKICNYFSSNELQLNNDILSIIKKFISLPILENNFYIINFINKQLDINLK